MFEFLLELAYTRDINDIDVNKIDRTDLTTIPTIYDTPDVNNRIKLTY